MASDNYQYSTLEVAIDRTDGIEYDTSPEPVVLAPSAPKYDSAPEPVLLSPNSQKYDASSRGSVVLSPNSQKYDTSPEPVFITPVTPKFPPIGPPVDNQANAGFNDFAQVTGSPEPKRPWWKAKRVWVTAVVAVVVVAALLGGLLGYFLHKKATSSSATAAAAGDTGPLANSRLAAMNWTDSNKVERKAVFYQYDGALLYTQYDASNDTWASVNLTQSFARDNNGTILDVKPGTPLAVAVPSKDVIDWWDAQFGGPTGWWQVNLFYMDNDNHLRDIVTSDDNLGSWSEGELGASAIEADEESQLSAFAYYCAEGSVTSDGDLESTACSLYPALTYQNTDQRFVVIWGGDWSSENDTTVLDKSVQGADYAMLPYASDGTNRSDISSYDVFYYSDGAMSYYMYDAVTESYNGNDGVFTSETQVEVNGKVPQVAAMPTDYFTGAMLASMLGNGSFMASYAEGLDWTANQRVNFTNADGSTTVDMPSVNLTRITADFDSSIYAIEMGTTNIIRYSWTTDDRSNIRWKETIAVNATL